MKTFLSLESEGEFFLFESENHRKVKVKNILEVKKPFCPWKVKIKAFLLLESESDNRFVIGK